MAVVKVGVLAIADGEVLLVVDHPEAGAGAFGFMNGDTPLDIVVAVAATAVVVGDSGEALGVQRAAAAGVVGGEGCTTLPEEVAAGAATAAAAAGGEEVGLPAAEADGDAVDVPCCCCEVCGCGVRRGPSSRACGGRYSFATGAKDVAAGEVVVGVDAAMPSWPELCTEELPPLAFCGPACPFTRSIAAAAVSAVVVLTGLFELEAAACFFVDAA